MSNHTPGPWIIEWGGDTEENKYPLFIKSKKDDMYILETDDGHFGPNKYDALLIAASPTMVEYIERQAAKGDKEAIDLLNNIKMGRS